MSVYSFALRKRYLKPLLSLLNDRFVSTHHYFSSNNGSVAYPTVISFELDFEHYIIAIIKTYCQQTKCAPLSSSLLHLPLSPWLNPTSLRAHPRHLTRTPILLTRLRPTVQVSDLLRCYHQSFSNSQYRHYYRTANCGHKCWNSCHHSADSSFS